MITITQFSISNDLKEMQLNVSVGSSYRVTEVVLWNQDTFKDDTKKIDLSSKLSGASESESLSIVPSDINESDFSGLYLVQITSNDPGDNPALVAAISLRQYYSVITKLLFTVNASCLNCNTNLQNAILIDMYLEAIKTALQVGRFRDAITSLEKINIVTHPSNCDVCTPDTVNGENNGWITVGVLDCVLELNPLA